MTSPATAPVSAIIPCHNCAASVERAIASVLFQTSPPAELILVDDASDDGGATRRRLHALRDGYRGPVRVEIIEHPANLGAAVARNSGWEAATQTYLAFLDADDAWDASKLEIQCSWMEQHPGAAMSGHRHALLLEGETGGISARHANLARIGARRIPPLHLLLSNVFATRTVMVRRALPLRFDPRFRRSDDYLLWLSIAHGGNEVWLLDPVLAYSFKAAYGEGGLSQDLWAMEKSELAVYDELARVGAISPLLHWLLAPYSLLKYAKRVAGRAFATSRSQSSPLRS
jgi:teichuronic acid biosynthesis glycosyltransferase TuaG